jgi:hypothetical protein
MSWSQGVMVMTVPDNPRPLADLLAEADVPTRAEIQEVGSGFAGMQAQFDALAANLQRQVDQLREDIKGA